MMSDNYDYPPEFGTFAPNGVQQFFRRCAAHVPRGYAGRKLASLLLGPAGGRRKRAFDVTVFDRCDVRLYPADNISEKRVYLTPHFWDPEERKLLAQSVCEHDAPVFNFVDLGANAGLYTLFVWSIAQREGKTINAVCVDAAAEMRRRLSTNLSLCGAAGQVKIVPFAVTDLDGPLVFAIDKKNRGMSSISDAGLKDSSNELYETEKVEGRTLQTIVDDAGLDRIDAMKIDIEGHESRALGPFFQRADKALWPKLVIIETSHDKRSQTILSDAGYTPIFEDPKNSVFRLA